MIIGIHGLSNKPPAEALMQGWEVAMLEGLQKNTGTNLNPEDLNFISVYWADVMYDQPDDNAELYRQALPGTLRRYRDNWWDRFRAWASSSIDDVIDRWRQEYGVDEVAEEVLRLKLRDLSRYYEEPQINSRLQARLSDQILEHRNRRIIVIAHSMGSIIAYDVLHQLQHNPAIAIDHFITIGSPLGLPYVKAKAIEANDGPPRTPENVKAWVNFADRRDPVSIDTHLSDDYGANQEGIRVQDDLVMNDWGGIHHKSYGYLRTPEFSDYLQKALG
ncbi:MAG: hypothetical protein AXA67_07855 [Methylothermaceae bacteria B42]|nr:MAG: hypothetical protein AXA67_07855 [Methylothermaceae bacteria B42]HHJ37912.1 hypothetical protein [Methylothermaceae bacterium]